MPKFRKRPVVIDAIQWNGKNVAEVSAFLAGSTARFDDSGGLKIPTREGEMLASIGDWIIRGIKSEIYPCKPEIFEATYESVEPVKDWVIQNIHAGNVAQPSGESTKEAPTAYHSPRLKRTIMDGPGNRSSIIGCSCGAAPTYIAGHMSDWYARHTGIVGGSARVRIILWQYDSTLDVRDYPDLEGTATCPQCGAAAQPEDIISSLRVG